jgi:hypothetical protein
MIIHHQILNETISSETMLLLPIKQNLLLTIVPLVVTPSEHTNLLSNILGNSDAHLKD